MWIFKFYKDLYFYPPFVLILLGNLIYCNILYDIIMRIMRKSLYRFLAEETSR